MLMYMNCKIVLWTCHQRTFENLENFNKILVQLS